MAIFDPWSLTSGQFLLGFFGAALALSVVFFVALYIYSAIALTAIARKAHTQPEWFAWIPILNAVLLLKMGGFDWRWIFAVLIVVIPVIGKYLVLAGFVYVWWQVCKRLHKPEWYAILMIVPFVNLVVLGYLAWAK